MGKPRGGQDTPAMRLLKQQLQTRAAELAVRLRQFGSKAQHAATESGRLVQWLLRCCLLLISPLYPILKWIASAVFLALLISLLANYMTGGVDPSRLKAATEFMAAHRTLAVRVLVGSLTLFVLARAGYVWREKDLCLRLAFDIYRPAHKLRLEELGFRLSHPQGPNRSETHREERPFFGTYFPRKAVEDSEPTDTDADAVHEYPEDELGRLLRNGRGFLLCGPPYSGKTITLLQILRAMRGYVVISPDASQSVPDEEALSILRGQNIVILVDNLAALAGSKYDLGLLVRRIAKAAKRPCVVAGTCREGGDLAAIAAGHGNQISYFCEGWQKLRLHPMDTAQRVALAASAGITLGPQDARNYPLPGNITMRDRTQAMAERFRTLTEPSKDALRAMKLLDAGSIPLTRPRLHTVLVHVFDRSLEQPQMEETLRILWDEFFLLEPPSTGSVSPHFGHLLYAVSYPEGQYPEDERWDNMARVLGGGARYRGTAGSQ